MSSNYANVYSKSLCSSKITNRRLSKPYDISTNQTETDANVYNCWQVFPVWCNTDMQNIEFQQNVHPSPVLVNIICVTSLKTIFSHLCVYAKINNIFTNPLKLLYLQVHNSPQDSAHFIECISLKSALEIDKEY